MKDDRAVELVKYGLYAQPKMKNEAEYREAVRHVANRPDLWDQLPWKETS